MAQLLNTPGFQAERRKANKGRYLDGAAAERIYSRGTQLDEFTGSYPPEDTGSSGLGVSKAARELGYVGRYFHAFGLTELFSAISQQPVLVGTMWYDGMTWLNRGYAEPKGETLGGHEYLCIGANFQRHYLTFLNSWGPYWGQRGRFRMTFDHFGELLDDDGDVIVPVGSI